MAVSKMSLEKYYPRGDFDESSRSSLNEVEWRSYLSSVDSEVKKFLRMFLCIRHMTNHMDMIFAKMKWGKVVLDDQDEWDGDSSDITTFHKSPINIATKGLFVFVEKMLDWLTGQDTGATPKECWNFAKLAGDIRVEMLSGVANTDTGEYLLGICHFKNAISVVQRALVAVNRFRERNDKFGGFCRDFLIVLFDLRELAWCGITMCKVAARGDDD